MAFPTFVGMGALQESTTTLTVVNHASAATGDYELLVIETSNEAATLTTPGGFTAVPFDDGAGNGIWGTGVAANIISTRLTLFERIFSGQADPVTNDPGNHVIANIFTFRKSSGTWATLDDVRSPTEDTCWKATTQATEVTAASMDGITTDTVDQLIIGITCAGKPDIAGGTAEMGTVTNANLASITERHDDAAASGNGGWIGVWTGQEATSGQAIGSSTYTKTAASVMVHLVLAIRDAPPAGGGGTTFERQSAFGATADIAVAEETIRIRTSAFGATAAIATAKQTDHVKSVAIASVGGIVSAKETVRIRSAALDATATVVIDAHEILRVFERAAAIGASVLLSTGREHDHIKSVAISSTALLAAARQLDLLRAVAIDGTVGIASVAEVFKLFERAAAIAATVDISSAQETEHIFTRSASFTATVNMSVVDFLSILERSADIGVEVLISVGSEVEPAGGWPFVFEDDEWRFKGNMRLFRRPTGRWSGTGSTPPTREVPGRAARLAKWNAEGSAHE